MEKSKLQDIQLLEQNLQNLLIQKQVFQMELAETESALKEIEKSGEEVFKIIGQIMIKTGKSSVKDELLNKEKILNLRIKTIEKQESYLMGNLENLKEEMIKNK